MNESKELCDQSPIYLQHTMNHAAELIVGVSFIILAVSSFYSYSLVNTSLTKQNSEASYLL